MSMYEFEHKIHTHGLKSQKKLQINFKLRPDIVYVCSFSWIDVSARPISLPSPQSYTVLYFS